MPVHIDSTPNHSHTCLTDTFSTHIRTQADTPLFTALAQLIKLALLPLKTLRCHTIARGPCKTKQSLASVFQL